MTDKQQGKPQEQGREELTTIKIESVYLFGRRQISIWNTSINEAIRKAKLGSTVYPLEEIKEVIEKLEELKIKS